MANKVKKRFKQYTEDDIRKKRLKKESRHNYQAALNNAVNNWDELDNESKSSLYRR